MRISDWSSDVCSSDLFVHLCVVVAADLARRRSAHLRSERQRVGRADDEGLEANADAGESRNGRGDHAQGLFGRGLSHCRTGAGGRRSEGPTAEIQSLMRISYAVFRLKKKTYKQTHAKGGT